VTDDGADLIHRHILVVAAALDEVVGALRAIDFVYVEVNDGRALMQMPDGVGILRPGTDATTQVWILDEDEAVHVDQVVAHLRGLGIHVGHHPRLG
jgi:hypothetical protein